MLKNKTNLNKNMINLKLTKEFIKSITKEFILKNIKSPSNWVIVILTYIIWLLVGMSYYTNQNFNMEVTIQNYIMLLSLVSIVIGSINHETKLVKLSFIGAITFILSFLMLAVSKVGIYRFGYPVGYYLLCPLTLLLFLVQIKDICFFAYCKYYGALREGIMTIDTNKPEKPEA